MNKIHIAAVALAGFLFGLCGTTLADGRTVEGNARELERPRAPARRY
jgi:hypothetical protein